MRIEDHLQTLADADRDEFNRRVLQILGYSIAPDSQFVFNLRAECRLARDAWVEIVSMVLAAAPDARSLRAAIITACRTHKLTGGQIAPPWPTRYGRAVTKDNFYRHLANEGRVTDLRGAAALLGYLNRHTLAETHAHLGRTALGRYFMWATFDRSDPAAGPFDGMPDDADVIRGRLGLDQRDAGKDLLLLVYSLPAGIPPLYPTIADAYSSDPPWLANFRPAPAEEPCGRTQPWPSCNDAACPEVVHEVVNGSALEDTIRVVIPR